MMKRGGMSRRIPKATDHRYRLPSDGSFHIRKAPTTPPEGASSAEACEKRLAELTQKLDHLQHLFFAHGRRSLLLIFQGMDASGKDSTVRAVLSGVDPAGVDVTAFKEPSADELAHDFLWRAVCRLPQRGRIGVFNRSYYEDVLITRVHPQLLDGRHVDLPKHLDKLWDERFESIRDFEKHITRNGVTILKFFLHVSKAEQRRRFLARLEDPQKHWKFSESDVRERDYWQAYQDAYEEALRATTCEHAPWYAVPADDKPFLRMTVAEIIVDTLESLDLHYPEIGNAQKRRFGQMRSYLKKG
jgi:PPK2 family polyphosphate:nucleotide phosphotransferase